jgi:hypothetical protein
MDSRSREEQVKDIVDDAGGRFIGGRRRWLHR